MVGNEWYLYDYAYNDDVPSFELQSHIHNQHKFCRHTNDRSFIELTNKPYDYINPVGVYSSKDEGIYWLDYHLHRYGKADTFTYLNDNLWDTYIKKQTEYERAFDELHKYNLIEELHTIEFEHECFVKGTANSEFEVKNKYVYFLKKNGEVVYVGQTQATAINRANRPNSHQDKDYDSFDIIKIDDSMDINIVESYYIMKHKPKYNKSLPIAKEWQHVLKFALKTTWTPYKK
jgi:hypothetical protein